MIGISIMKEFRQPQSNIRFTITELVLFTTCSKKNNNDNTHYSADANLSQLGPLVQEHEFGK